MAQWEGENEEDSVVVLSDVWLDKPETLDRLRAVFSGEVCSRCCMRDRQEMVPHAARLVWCTIFLLPVARVHACRLLQLAGGKSPHELRETAFKACPMHMRVSCLPKNPNLKMKR